MPEKKRALGYMKSAINNYVDILLFQTIQMCRTFDHRQIFLDEIFISTLVKPL